MRRSLRVLGVLVGSSVALLLAYRSASSAPPAPPATSAAAPSVTPTATAAASAPATSTAAASSDKPAAAPLPAVSSVSWPEETSKPPSLDEWKSAQELAPRGGGASNCRVRRVREWVRVRCLEGKTLEVEQIAGPQVHTLGIEVPPLAYADVGSGGTVFPVRRGDRRVLQWLTPRYTSVVEAESGVVVTEQWLPEDPGPLITIDNVEQHRGPVTDY